MTWGPSFFYPLSEANILGNQNILMILSTLELHNETPELVVSLRASAGARGGGASSAIRICWNRSCNGTVRRSSARTCIWSLNLRSIPRAWSPIRISRSSWGGSTCIRITASSVSVHLGNRNLVRLKSVSLGPPWAAMAIFIIITACGRAWSRPQRGAVGWRRVSVSWTSRWIPIAGAWARCRCNGWGGGWRWRGVVGWARSAVCRTLWSRAVWCRAAVCRSGRRGLIIRRRGNVYWRWRVLIRGTVCGSLWGHWCWRVWGAVGWWRWRICAWRWSWRYHRRRCVGWSGVVALVVVICIRHCTLRSRHGRELESHEYSNEAADHDSTPCSRSPHCWYNKSQLLLYL